MTLRATVAALAEALESQAEVASRLAAVVRQLEAEQPSSRLLGAKEAAARVGIAAATMRALLRQGALPATRIGDRLLVSEEALAAFVRRQTLRSPVTLSPRQGPAATLQAAGPRGA